MAELVEENGTILLSVVVRSSDDHLCFVVGSGLGSPRSFKLGSTSPVRTDQGRSPSTGQLQSTEFSGSGGEEEEDSDR
jgi:hypothetical protein